MQVATATDQFLEYCSKELGHSPKTIDNYAREFGKFNRQYGNKYVKDITLEDLKLYFRSEEGRGLAISSVNTARHVFRSFFYYCQYYRKIPLEFDYGMIRQKKDYAKKQLKCASVDDVIRTISALEDPQDKLIVATTFDAGIRISELTKLRVEDVHHKYIEVRGKGGKPRYVPISLELTQALEDHIEANEITTGTVFRHRVPRGSLANHGYSVSGLRNRFIRKLKPYGIYPAFHWYRHGKATDLYDNGADIRFIQEFLGHSDIRTTQIYTHVSTKRKRETYDKYYPEGLSLSNLLDNPAQVC